MACYMQQYTDLRELLGPTCRTSYYIVRVKHSIKLVQKYIIYLGNWGTKQRWSTWMTSRGRVVKSGYFSVITIGNGEPKKFLVALGYLSYPPFLKLLEAAEREFGFEQQGVLVIPCEASELQNILLHA